MKVTTIALVTALANPLCCCLSLASPDIESSKQEADAHACCHSEYQRHDSKHAQPEQNECPHTESQQMKISPQSGDLQLGLADPLNLSSNYYEYLQAPESAQCLAGGEHRSQSLTFTANAPPGAAKSRAHCVYLF